MNKSDLITKIINLNSGVYQKEATKIVNIFFNTISDAISKNDRVELRGFGVFSANKQKARISRNPKTGEKVHTPEKKTIHFKMAKDLFKKLNNEEK